MTFKAQMTTEQLQALTVGQQITRLTAKDETDDVWDVTVETGPMTYVINGHNASDPSVCPCGPTWNAEQRFWRHSNSITGGLPPRV